MPAVFASNHCWPVIVEVYYGLRELSVQSRNWSVWSEDCQVPGDGNTDHDESC